MITNRTYNTLKVDLHEHALVLSINRPEKLNALNSEVLHELLDFFSELHQSPKLNFHAVILTGEGEKSFVAGADIAQLAEMNYEQAKKLGRLGHRVTLLMEQVKLPIIACVNGFALGGGLELALACDFILCTHNAIFALPEVSLGLIPGFGGTQRLARLLGANNAKYLIYTGRKLNADKALELGLVQESFKNKSDLMQYAYELTQLFAQNSALAIATSKKVMNKGNDKTLVDGLSLELEEFAGLFNSKDMREGTEAFIQKRKPEF